MQLDSIHHKSVDAGYSSAMLLGAAYAWLLLMAYELSSSLVFDDAQRCDLAQLWVIAPKLGQVRDWIENFLLGLPAGFLFTLYYANRARAMWGRVLRAILPVIVAAVAMELAQCWMPARTASMWDAALMVLGAAAGSGIGWIVWRYWLVRRARRVGGGVAWIAGIAFVSWLLAAWIPTNLQLEQDGIDKALAPLATLVDFSWGTMAWVFACWLGLARLTDVPLSRLFPLVFMTWLGNLLAPGRALAWEVILGGCLFLLLWPLLRRPRWSVFAVLSGLIIAFCLKAWGLAPATDIRFGDARLIGDGALFAGSWLVALIVLVQHYLPLYMGMALAAGLLPRRQFISVAVPLIAGGLIVVELLRTLFTEGDFRLSPMFALVVATVAILRYVYDLLPSVPGPERPIEIDDHNLRDAAPWQPAGSMCLGRLVSHLRAGREVLRRGAGLLVLAVVVSSLLLALVVHLPGIPYNVRELFATRVIALSLLLFVLFLFWSAAAPNLLARLTVLCPPLHLLQPLLFLLLAIPSWLLLRYSVSAESLWDILGSPVLGWPGDWELFLRYLAFSAPFLLWIYLWNLLFEAATQRKGFFCLRPFLAGLVMALPLFLSSKWIVVDLAATDNIRELIAGAASVPALLAVFLLLGMISLHGVMVGWVSLKGLRYGVAVALASPFLWLAGWWLLHRSLTQEAIAFLLSAGRQQLASESALLVRWTVAYMGAVAAMGGAHSLLFAMRNGKGRAAAVMSVAGGVERTFAKLPAWTARTQAGPRLASEAMDAADEAIESPRAAVRIIAVVLFILAILLAFSLPTVGLWVALVLVAYVSLLFRYPAAWLLLLPSVLAIVNLAPWTGRFFFDESDAFVMATLAVFLWQGPFKNIYRHWNALNLVFILLVIVYAISVMLALWPLPPLDANALSNYYSPYNTLRVAKSLFWAFFLWPALHAAKARGVDVRKLFSRGLLVALAGVALTVVWERWAFPGLLNFSNDYRVTGSFASMHTGGAFVDGFLALSIPLIALLFRGRTGWLTFALPLSAIAVYAALVTYSRGTYAALAVSVLILLAFAVFGSQARIRTSSLLTVMFTLVLAVGSVTAVLQGRFMPSRFATVERDLGVRFDHWRDAASQMDPGLLTSLFGMGPGAFPVTFFWRNREGVVPANYRLAEEQGVRYLSMGFGDRMSLDQRVGFDPYRTYQLTVRYRSNDPNVHPRVALCEKSLLYTKNCGWYNLTGIPETGWQTVTQKVTPGSLAEPWAAERPRVLSVVLSGSPKLMDLALVSLRDSSGKELIRNGDFAAGMDHWFFSVDNHLPWHIKNVLVSSYFDTGLLGMTAFVFLILVVFVRLVRQTSQGDPDAPAFLASLAGVLIVGFIDSLFDDPRLGLLLWLFFLMAADHGLIVSSANERQARYPRQP